MYIYKVKQMSISILVSLHHRSLLNNSFMLWQTKTCDNVALHAIEFCSHSQVGKHGAYLNWLLTKTNQNTIGHVWYDHFKIFYWLGKKNLSFSNTRHNVDSHLLTLLLNNYVYFNWSRSIVYINSITIKYHL